MSSSESSRTMQVEQVDLSSFFRQPICSLDSATDAQLQTSSAIHQALLKDGVFGVTLNILDEPLMTSAFAAAHDLFTSDKDVKAALPSVNDAGFIRGYLGYGAESGRKEFFEPKEGFSYGHDWPQDVQQNKLKGPNCWPSENAVADPATWKKTMTDMYVWAADVSKAVVAAIALALGRPPAELLSTCDEGDKISLMRLFRYHPAVADRTCLGSSPHTDWGFLTVIVQDQVGGLQVKKDGEWFNVSAEQCRIVVNGGDYLKLLTRGAYASPIHQVLCPKEKRQSFVYFFYPNPSTRLNSSLWTPEAVEEASNQEYNTLMDQAGCSIDSSFDSYICEKWQGVQRKPVA